jgi:hypothetical protein
MDEKIYILQEKFSPFRGTIQLVSFLFQVKMSVPGARCVAPALSAEDKTCENVCICNQVQWLCNELHNQRNEKRYLYPRTYSYKVVCIIQIMHVSYFSLIK